MPLSRSATAATRRIATCSRALPRTTIRSSPSTRAGHSIAWRNDATACDRTGEMDRLRSPRRRSLRDSPGFHLERVPSALPALRGGAHDRARHGGGCVLVSCEHDPGCGIVVRRRHCALFDCAIVTAFVLTYHFEQGTPTRQLLFLPLAEAAVRFAIPGALAVAALFTPVAAIFEWLRSDRFHDGYRFDYVTFQFGALALMGLIVGWLVGRIGEQTALSGARALEAEKLRDALGRRVDVLEAANRCAR